MAWHVYRMMLASYKERVHQHDEHDARYQAFVEHLTGNSIYEDKSYAALALDVGTWTPEKICIAALQACGIEVEL